MTGALLVTGFVAALLAGCTAFWIGLPWWAVLATYSLAGMGGCLLLAAVASLPARKPSPSITTFHA